MVTCTTAFGMGGAGLLTNKPSVLEDRAQELSQLFTPTKTNTPKSFFAEEMVIFITTTLSRKRGGNTTVLFFNVAEWSKAISRLCIRCKENTALSSTEEQTAIFDFFTGEGTNGAWILGHSVEQDTKWMARSRRCTQRTEDTSKSFIEGKTDTPDTSTFTDITGFWTPPPSAEMRHRRSLHRCLCRHQGRHRGYCDIPRHRASSTLLLSSSWKVGVLDSPRRISRTQNDPAISTTFWDVRPSEVSLTQPTPDPWSRKQRLSSEVEKILKAQPNRFHCHRKSIQALLRFQGGSETNSVIHHDFPPRPQRHTEGIGSKTFRTLFWNKSEIVKLLSAFAIFKCMPFSLPCFRDYCANLCNSLTKNCAVS